MKFENLPHYQNTSAHNLMSGHHRQPEKRGYFEIRPLSWLEESCALPKGQDERISFYEIFCVKEGSGFLKVDGKMHPVASHAVYCLGPGQVRNYMPGRGSNGYRISFSADFLFIGAACKQVDSWIDVSVTNVAMITTDEDMQLEIEVLIQAMKKEFMNYSLLRAEILSGLLNVFLIHLTRKLPMEDAHLSLSKDGELVQKFKMLLKEHFITKKMVADYAGDLCVTPNYLNKTVKKITGFTASYHIQQKIILEAKRRAIHSSGSMKEIAYFLGFDNLAHFSKFFKNNSGMNFTSFKRGLMLPA